MDDGLVDTITTDRNGRAFLSLEDGSYYAVETEANPDFILDDTPHYFEVKDGKVTTLRLTNAAKSGILIHKVDTSGEGIYGVKFLLYDEDRNPIGEFTSDDDGYVYITADDLPDGANTSGRFYLRELEAAEGYILDEEYKTVYVRPGHTAEIEWVNEPSPARSKSTSMPPKPIASPAQRQERRSRALSMRSATPGPARWWTTSPQTSGALRLPSHSL